MFKHSLCTPPPHIQLCNFTFSQHFSFNIIQCALLSFFSVNRSHRRLQKSFHFVFVVSTVTRLTCSFIPLQQHQQQQQQQNQNNSINFPLQFYHVHSSGLFSCHKAGPHTHATTPHPHRCRRKSEIKRGNAVN